MTTNTEPRTSMSDTEQSLRKWYRETGYLKMTPEKFEVWLARKLHSILKAKD